MVFPILPANTLSGGYDIDNSLRFNNPDDPNLSITFGSAGDRRTFTISAWIKKGDISDDRALIGQGGTSAGNPRGLIFVSSGLRFTNNTSGSSTDTDVWANAKLRDHSAWYHVVAAVDTTQGTASNRVKLYINGVHQTSLAAATYPDEDFEMNWNNNVLHTVGRYPNNDAYHMDGYISEFYFIDGTQYAASDFGETDEDSGIWKPKDAKDDLTFGTNGFYLEFKQSGTDQDASGMGADTSGEDNHLAVNNLTAVDQTTDTPTNNFATLNPLANSSYTTLSEGNLKTTGNTATNKGNTESTMAVANDKWYWEHKMTTGASPYYPTTGALKPETVGRLLNAGDGMVGAVTDSVGYEFDGDRRISNTSTDDHFSSLSDGDILGIALDMDNGAVYFSKAGTWENSSDPTSGASKTNAAHTWTADGRYMMAATSSYNSSVAEINFGNPSFTISSGNADANGYGNFEYAVPSGYYALCTKNLAEYG